MRSRLFAVTFAMLALLVLAMPVSAGRQWCAKDPIVLLNGAELQIWVAVQEQDVPLVSGPVEVEVVTPAGVTREVIFLDEGFNNHGEVVTFTDHGGRVNAGGVFDVQVNVIVPIAGASVASIPVQITLINRDTQLVREGTSAGTSASIRVKGAR
jgi:hypothetical protein